jgi:hypothetical protein
MRETCLAAARWSLRWTFLYASFSPLLAAEKTVTRQEAQTLPASELADRMLGASAAPYSEVERPGEPSGPFAGDYPELQSLRFATSPRWSGLHGLCFADTVFLSLGRPNNIEQPHRNSPVVVQGISTAQVYRFIGPPERGRPSSASDDSAQKEECRRAGPVFHPPGTQLGSRFFYGQSDYSYDLHAVHAYFAGWALETAQHALAEGRNVAVTCAEDPSEPKGRLCAEPSSLIRQLQLTDISFVALERCKGDPSTFCAEITFTRPGGSEDKEKVWRIGLTTDATGLEPLPKTLEVRRVSMEAWTVVE